MATQVAVPLKKKSVPDENPFTCVMVMCPLCGQIVLPTIKRMANGHITEITYYHVNEVFGCAWKLVDPKDRARGECVGLKSSVREGNDAQSNPLFIDEHDLAAGRSFDLDGLKPGWDEGAKRSAGADKAGEILELVDKAKEIGHPKMEFRPPNRPAPLNPENQPATEPESKSETGGGTDAE